MEFSKLISMCFILTWIFSNMVVAEDLPDDLEEGRSNIQKISFGTCDYVKSKPPHRSCENCNELIRCRSDNVSIRKNCGGFFKHCNEDRCSKVPSKICAAKKKQ